MLALKLLLVPSCIAIITLASHRWGPKVGGWLAGFPVIVGPILLILALDRGIAFAIDAAIMSLAGIFALIAFGVAYAWSGRYWGWFSSAVLGLIVWFAAATFLVATVNGLVRASIIAAIALIAAPWSFPIPTRHVNLETPPVANAKYVKPASGELFVRMLASLIVTLGVTMSSQALGPMWSGVLAIFPTLGGVLAVFSHATHGGDYAATLLRGMAMGLWSIAAFTLTLVICFKNASNETSSIPLSFACALVVALAVQLIARWVFIADRK